MMRVSCSLRPAAGGRGVPTGAKVSVRARASARGGDQLLYAGERSSSVVGTPSVLIPVADGVEEMEVRSQTNPSSPKRAQTRTHTRTNAHIDTLSSSRSRPSSCATRSGERATMLQWLRVSRMNFRCPRQGTFSSSLTRPLTTFRPPHSMPSCSQVRADEPGLTIRFPLIRFCD